MTPLSAALLAGGKSTRMGRDKCRIMIDGVPLWRRQLGLLAQFSDDLMIVAPAPPAWLPTSARFVPDAAVDAGPLAGLVAALDAMRHDRLLIVAVDLPRLTPDLLARLAASPTALVPQIDAHFEPLCAVYPRSAEGLAKERLARGELALQPLVRDLVAAGLIESLVLATGDSATFLNLNRPEDLDSLEEPPRFPA